MGLEIIGSNEEPLSWEVFEQLVQEDIHTVKKEREAAVNTAEYSPWIYRGHSNANWELLTTLERYRRDEFNDTQNTYAAWEYYSFLDGITPTINSLL